jgi:UDP-N-acetylglucosamine--N-acetylmuramyl-(pentapeptide) pyrophosphoryl-undecaprenol N-acetylglucosamine transferase
VVATAYAESAAYMRSRRAVVTGTPVRRDFQRRRPAFPHTPRRLLVVGGSQGAHRINLAVAQAIPELLRVDEVEVSHQTGPADLAEMERVKAALPQEIASRYQPFAFADDLPTRLQASDLVVSRAGASTISETGALGIPMVLIPGPFAGGHQKYNARPFAEAGAAVIIPNEECDGKRLTSELTGIIKDPARYRTMVDAMRTMGRPNAADDVAALLQQVAKH